MALGPVDNPFLRMQKLIPKSFFFTVSIDSSSHPYLDSHIIQGVIVLPVCLVLEWFMQAVHLYLAASEAIVCRNFHMLRSVKLVDFYRKETSFLIHCQQKAEKKWSVSLSSALDPTILYYRADLSMINQPDNSNQHLKSDGFMQNATGWPFDLDAIYMDTIHKGYLPHGEQFHSISCLDRVSDQGCSAYLKGIRNKNWPGNWLFDSLIMDGVAQLAGLWTGRMLNKVSLPVGVEELIFYKQPLPDDALFCIMRGYVKGNYHTCFDVLLLDKHQKKYVEISGLKMFCYKKTGDIRI